MPPNRSPLVVIVPGACGRVSGFDKIIPHLNGLETVPGVYPSCNPSNLNATCLGDTSELRRTLLYLLGYERDLVILAHSYGAAVASGAAKRLDKTSRLAEGHSTSVIGLIFIAGNLCSISDTLSLAPFSAAS
ncbi:hypothetical protein NPX13_g6127 [Xylaria arbuscula]|uniref:AB hydrolase-1 domain-containing protein n=1 Tax=Xylaria arbuscula TaxID=114810 RepID=A0A9W8ND46_9PEZI|nr:hypothetical protein NPX13_g6127 [Xylaria arbuscula]